MEKKIRMADIAKELGVSVVSVSKALSGQSGVSTQTRERILELAREWGYVPLRTKKPGSSGVVTGNIGILVADRFFSDSKFYSDLYRHVLMCCNEQGFSALLELVTPEAEKSCTIPAIVQSRKVAARHIGSSVPSRFHMYMLIYGICFSLSDLLHSV